MSAARTYTACLTSVAAETLDPLARFNAAESAFNTASIRARICLAGGSTETAEHLFGEAERRLEAERDSLLEHRGWMMTAHENDIRRVLG